MEFKLEDRIGEGRYRDVYRVDRTTCAKVIKKSQKKKIGNFEFECPTWVDLMLKMIPGDFNQREFKNYQKLMALLPEEIKQYFGKIYRVESDANYSVAICGLITDFDGKPSLALRDFGKVEDPRFWKAIEIVIGELSSRRIPYFFGKGRENVVVKRNRDCSMPLFIDYKWFGMTPFQPWIYLPGKIEERLEKRLERFNKYRG
jgi:hypothetical protein